MRRVGVAMRLRREQGLLMARPRRPPPQPFTPRTPACGDGAAWSGRAIPRPPSMNGLYRNNKDRRSGQKGRVRTARYDGWCAEAGWKLRVQGTLPRVAGKYELAILLGRRKGSDLDNYAKALCDWLKKIGVIDDDSLCERLSLEWCDDLNAKQAYFFIRPTTLQAATSVIARPKLDALVCA